MTLADLKRRHNRLLTEGQEIYARLELMYREILRLQADIQKMEGDDYDPIPMMFGCGFDIDEVDERTPAPDPD